MYLTDYKSNLHALTLYINLWEKINKGIPPTLIPKAEEPIKTMALPTVNSDSDTNLDQNETTWTIFEAESPPENTVVTTKFSARKPTRTVAGRRRKPCLTSQRRDLSSYRSLTQLQKRCHLISNLGQTAQKSNRAGRKCVTFAPLASNQNNAYYLPPKSARKGHPMRAKLSERRAKYHQWEPCLQSH